MPHTQRRGDFIGSEFGSGSQENTFCHRDTENTEKTFLCSSVSSVPLWQSSPLADP